MRQRRETVEHPFGTLKMRMGATHFLTKRLPKVATEMALHVLAYNMKRVMKILGVGGLMEAKSTHETGPVGSDSPRSLPHGAIRRLHGRIPPNWPREPRNPTDLRSHHSPTAFSHSLGHEQTKSDRRIESAPPR